VHEFDESKWRIAAGHFRPRAADNSRRIIHTDFGLGWASDSGQV
jgi:hypothetical protein